MSTSPTSFVTSTITDVVAAHLHRRTSHTAESLVESRLLMTQNDPIEHWLGNHGDPIVNPHFLDTNRIERLYPTLKNSGGFWVILRSGSAVN